ncbi:MAG: transporter substrate-binding domain-containing protein [Bacteroidota bacterium]
MNKFIKTALTYAFLLVFISCSSTNKDQRITQQEVDSSKIFSEPIDFDYAKIKASGTLKAIIENSSTSYFLYRGTPMGFEYELLQKLAQDLDLKLELIVTNNIRDAFEKLNTGEGDILAYNMTVTKERKEIVAFTNYHTLVKQVLVQRKPENWRDLKRHETESQLIRNAVDLIGKEVVVRRNSSFVDRLENLSDEVGGNILIAEDFDDVQTEDLIKKVANGEIKYTVADENIALVNAAYYPNIDVKTPLSLSQQIAWATRKNSKEFLEKVNNWVDNNRSTLEYNVVYNKYFKNTRASARRVKSGFLNVDSDHISEYDELIKKAAEKIDWDWKLLASQMYQESKFDPKIKSWAGAVGLMQVLPRTAESYGVTNLYDPEENIKAATEHILWLMAYWEDKIEDPKERTKFILASYNVGQSHVMDAMRLTEKYGKNKLVWKDNVEQYLLLKSKPEYYLDVVVQSGYCRGEEPVKYVDQIFERYRIYSGFINT